MTGLVEKILFFGKGGRPRTLTIEQLRKGLPREVNSETYFFISRKTDEETMKMAKKVVKSWTKEVRSTQNDDNLSFEHRE